MVFVTMQSISRDKVQMPPDVVKQVSEELTWELGGGLVAPSAVSTVKNTLNLLVGGGPGDGTKGLISY